MYYLINSTLGIYVTTMDKDEILSKIKGMESRKLVNPSGNNMWDSQRRLQFVQDVLTFLDTTFTKELYYVEQWKQKIYQSLQNEDGIFCYSWTQLAASDVLFNIKQLLIKDNTIAYDLLPICHDTKSVPVPHNITTEQNQRTTTERIIEHSATAIFHGLKTWHAKDTYSFYDKMICTLENEQRFSHRQLTPFESKLLVWARAERDCANETMIKDGFKTAIHTVCSIGGIIEDSVRQQNKQQEFSLQATLS